MGALRNIIVAALVIQSVAAAGGEGKHLFILSGQSNMYHMKPGESFIPAVEKAFGKDNVFVASVAKRGASIRYWDKDYPWEAGVPQGREQPGSKPKTREEFVSEFGNLYDALLNSVKKKSEGKTFETVTFVWMQGESDTKPEAVGKYFESFERVTTRMKNDLGIQKMNIVIGRLSDYGSTIEKKESWMKMRDLQVKYAEERDDCEWVNTDDLNDMTGKDGGAKNDLHYTKQGYITLGKRFAEKAIALIKKQQAAK